MSFTGKRPSNTYKDILQLDNSNDGVGTSLKTVKSADGTSSALQISDDGVKVQPQNDDTNKAFAVATKAGVVLVGVDSDASTINGSLFLDEDDLASDSAGALASQQSIKAYVDSKAGWNNSPTRIKILPSDFMPNDDQSYYNVAVEDEDASYGTRVTISSLELYAYIPIPTGFKATNAMVYCSQARAATVREGFIDGTSAVVKSDGMACNTEHDITDVTSSTTNYLIIRVGTTATTDVIYGGYITIEEA